MFSSATTGGLTFAKVISGISKSLTVVNQLIPLYKEVKPVIGNAKTILGVLKEFRGTKSNKPTVKKLDNKETLNKEKTATTAVSNINTPVFFN